MSVDNVKWTNNNITRTVK